MKKLHFTILILIFFILFIYSCSSSSAGGGISHPDDYKAKEYLKEYFDIEVKEPDIPSYLPQFKENLKKIIVDYNGEGSDLLDIALDVTDNNYLVETYNKAKIKRRKTWYYNDEIKGIAENKYFALLDSGLLRGARNLTEAKVGVNEVTMLLMNIATIKGQTRHYVGFTNDENIAANTLNLFKTYSPFNDENLKTQGLEMIDNNQIKEFSIKKISNNAKFLTRDTIYYSGKDISDIPRIINTLFSEGVIARIQVEPRMYYNNENRDGKLEFDLVFEFKSPEYKESFSLLIEQAGVLGQAYTLQDIEIIYGSGTSLSYTKV